MKINSFKDLEKFLKKHKINYPKEWNSKFSKITRKDRNASVWKDCRSSLYASNRMFNCLIFLKREMRFLIEKFTIQIEKKTKKKNLTNLMKKYSLTFDIIQNKIWPEFLGIDDKKFYLNLIKKGGKSYYKFNFTPELQRFEKLLGIKIPRKIKLPPKKDTITDLLKHEEYWKLRNYIIEKPKEERNNRDIVRKEAQEYFKSVCTYINQPKYNKSFFIFHQKNIKKEWNKYWNFYLKVR